MKNNVTLIGIGKLGLCFALTLERAGYNVLGVDVNQSYVEQVNSKTLKSSEKDVENYLQVSKNFVATTNLKNAIDHSNLIFVVVATPSLTNGRYDHSQIDGLIEKLQVYGANKEQKHFVICCTVMPGYTDSIKGKLEELNYTVSYNPEFIAQGTILRDQAYPDMVLIGEANPIVGTMIEDIYLKHTFSNPRICRMSPLEAEITKISLNCFLTTKIAYANMIGDIVLKAGGCPNTVLNAIGADSRIGQKYLKYGYGYGGPCFPRDNRALSIFATDIEMPAEISKATDKSNELHLKYQVDCFVKDNSISRQAVFNSVTYKPESTMLVESQQLKYAVDIARKGFNVLIRERQEVVDEVRAMYGELFQYEIKS